MNRYRKLQALNEVLQRCRKSPFYKDRLPEKRLSSLEELKLLPLTTKDDVRENSPYGFVCVPENELYQYHETFGTTGVPASTWLTKQDFLDLARSVNESGIGFNDKDVVLVRFPYAISTVALFTHAAAQMKNACVIPASSRTAITPFTRVVDLMRKLNVTVLASLPLQAVLIAETAEMLGLKPNRDFPKLRAINTAGEVLTPDRRKVIEDLWGVPVIDNYGMTEIGCAAVGCRYGVTHPFEDRFIFELLNEDLSGEVNPGETGYLAVTTLSRKATPLIRFFTGDRARILSGKCKCGKSISIEMRGRKQDIIRAGDHDFDLRDLGEIVSHLPCKRFWIAGPYRGGIRFVVEEEGQTDKLSPELVKKLEEQYNVKLKIEVVPKGTLYDRSELLSVGIVGKPRYVYTEQEMEQEAYLKSAKL